MSDDLLLLARLLEEMLGKADWIWDEQLGIHIPCCTECGEGPLTDESAIKSGICGRAI